MLISLSANRTLSDRGCGWGPLPHSCICGIYAQAQCQVYHVQPVKLTLKLPPFQRRPEAEAAEPTFPAIALQRSLGCHVRTGGCWSYSEQMGAGLAGCPPDLAHALPSRTAVSRSSFLKATACPSSLILSHLRTTPSSLPLTPLSVPIQAPVSQLPSGLEFWSLMFLNTQEWFGAPRVAFVLL